ncbi:NADP-dependent oxidoreductase [Portibacter marinus]|uniref:NADP-dependent oxidoreductase n=1 Tax=Portibacter marinus TaxID=2898660 RepID=UPI001F1D4D1A|nr:NADP-dependent oxidoreductase [Portibacter marinus]
MNKQQILRNRPVGVPDEKTWELIETEIPEVGDGEMLIRNKFISMDPAMRGWINDARSYIPPVKLDDVMRAGAVGEVMESKNDKFKKGDFVFGMGGVQQYKLTDGKGFYKVDPSMAPLETYTGTIGMPGMTAYFGLLDVGELKEGDVVLVSGAAGAVGSVVGQIAKIKNCTVIGIAGGPQKCNYIKKELGFDHAIDYKNENVRRKIHEYCPDGIDVYFDNVGGDILDHALTALKKKARVVICGAISQYNSTDGMKGPSNYMSLLVNGAKMEGFVIFHFADRYSEALQALGRWVAEGKIKTEETVIEGIENFRDTFLKLFSGDKRGKLVLKV